MAWRRNKKTGGWFEVPDEPIDTNGYMNQKIRQEAKPKNTAKTKQTLTERIDSLEKGIEEAKTKNQVLDLLNKNQIPYKEIKDSSVYLDDKTPKTKALDVEMDEGFRRIYYSRFDKGYILQKRQRVDYQDTGKKKKVLINENTYTTLPEYKTIVTRR